MKKIIGTTLVLAGLLLCCSEADTLGLQVLTAAAGLGSLCGGAALLGAFKEEGNQITNTNAL